MSSYKQQQQKKNPSQTEEVTDAFSDTDLTQLSRNNFCQNFLSALLTLLDMPMSVTNCFYKRRFYLMICMTISRDKNPGE